MRLLFVADPLEHFKTYKDSTFTMMREAAARGHTLFACEPQDLIWQRGGQVSALMRQVVLTGEAEALVHRAVHADRATRRARRGPHAQRPAV